MTTLPAASSPPPPSSPAPPRWPPGRPRPRSTTSSPASPCGTSGPSVPAPGSRISPCPTPRHGPPLHDLRRERSGGVWKTTNGATWDPVFDSAGVASIGALAVSPSNPNIVWVGTGDNANARSSYSGKGVFKSTDAGATWQMMGLPDIAAHRAHRRRSNQPGCGLRRGNRAPVLEEHRARRVQDDRWRQDVDARALRGRRDGRHRSRGGPPVTEDALRRDVRQAATAVAPHRRRSRNRRLPHGRRRHDVAKAGGRAADGHDRQDWARHLYEHPNVLYALVENLNPAANGGNTAAAQAAAANPSTRGGAPPAGIIGNELYRTDDGGATWHKTTDINVAGGKAPYSFNQLRIDPSDDNRVIVTSDSMTVSEDGGKTWDDRGVAGRLLPARVRRLPHDVVRPQDPKRILLGSDGGLQISFDGGHTSDYFPNIRAGEAYAVGVDMDDPYHVYAGFQDHDSWKGPVNGRWGRDHAGRLGHRRSRRRHVQRRRPDRQPLGLQHARDEPDGPDGPADRHPD